MDTVDLFLATLAFFVLLSVAALIWGWLEKLRADTAQAEIVRLEARLRAVEYDQTGLIADVRQFVREG